MKKIAFSFFIALTLSLTSTGVLAQGCSKSDDSSAEFESPIDYMQDESLADEADFEQLQKDAMEEFYAQNPEMKASMEMVQKYSKALFADLQNNPDTNIQILALMNGMYSKSTDDERKKVLKKAINQDASAYTLFIANQLCQSQTTLKDWCQSQKIAQLNLQKDDKNLAIYLQQLSHASNDEEQQDILEQAASRSEYINNYRYYYTLKVVAAIEEFNQSYSDLNVLTDLLIQTVNGEGIAQFDTKELKSKGLLKKDLTTAINESLPFTMAMSVDANGFMLGYELNRLCEKAINAENCLVIADIYAKSSSFMDKMQAQSLKHLANKALGVEDNSKVDHFAGIEQLSCLTNGIVMQASAVDKDLMILFIKEARKHGEQAAAKKMAQQVYNTIKQHGYNPSFDPKTCK